MTDLIATGCDAAACKNNDFLRAGRCLNFSSKSSFRSTERPPLNAVVLQMEDGIVASSLQPIVPYGADETVFVVIERSGARGGVSREIERSDMESVVEDLLSGQIGDPIRVLAFNTLEHWSKDLSAEIAREIQTRCDIDGIPVPEYLRDFVELSGAATLQPA